MKTFLLLLWLSLCSCIYKPEIKYYQSSNIEFLYQILLSQKECELYYFNPEYMSGDKNGNFKERYYFVIIIKYK